jgi:hypothetical protein
MFWIEKVIWLDNTQEKAVQRPGILERIQVKMISAQQTLFNDYDYCLVLSNCYSSRQHEPSIVYLHTLTSRNFQHRWCSLFYWWPLLFWWWKSSVNLLCLIFLLPLSTTVDKDSVTWKLASVIRADKRLRILARNLPAVLPLHSQPIFHPFPQGWGLK